MQDFILTTYKKLLEELLANGYSFQTLQDVVQQPEDKTVILRHDVDNTFILACWNYKIKNAGMAPSGRDEFLMKFG